MKNKKKKMRLSKFTKLTLSALMVLTCVHFSSVKAEDSSVEGSSSPETVEIVETPAPTTIPEIVETTPEPTPEVVESTPEPTPEVVEATPAPTVQPVVEETPVPATGEAVTETPAPVEASKEATEDKVNTVTKGYKLVEVTTLEEENSGEGTSVDENKEAAETFTVNYEVVVDGGEPLSDYENVVTLEGIKSNVNASEAVSFTVSPKEGYTVVSVKQNDTALTATENQYTTDPIELETTIRIELHEEVAAEEPVDENQTVPAAVTTTGEIMTDFYVKADRSTVTVGETVNVKAIIKPDSFSDKRVTWSSSNTDIATVDESGVVTTHAVGTVTITGKSVANEDMTDFDIITINPIQVSKITITGYTEEYMLPNETVKLNATVEPDKAADKSLIWTSSDKTIATVDQDGNVTALKQGEVTIRVANETSGKYAEQKIKVYDATPKTATVQIWVTNQYRGVSYQINLPADGTEVNASDVIQKVDGYVSTNIIRVVAGESGSDWSNIQKLEPVQKFKYENGKIKYTTDGSNWKKVGSDKIVAFYAINTNNTNPELGTTDVRVAVGDWPYNPGDYNYSSHNKQTIQITIVDGNNNLIYDSGRLRYDNGSNGEFGKIEIDCDESRYQIKEILVYRNNDSGTGTPYKTYEKVPEGGISVTFTNGQTNHYLIKSVVTPKEFDVTYDINGGQGRVPESTKSTAVNGTKVTVATSPQPTKEGYIFAGWEYAGTTYYGGESFEMPAHNVTFKAKWLQSSGVITYSSNNEEWGTVSRSYETLKAGVTEVKGSIAKANAGYIFEGWKNNQTGEIVSNDSHYKPEAKSGSYTAVFKVKANIKDLLKLEPGDVTAPYDGNAHAAGTATVTGNDVDGIKIEYQIADGSWTTNPSEITATNVSDSKTVNIRVTSEKYNGELTGTEKLTITPAAVTVKADSKTKQFGEADPELTATVTGLVDSYEITYTVTRDAGENVGEYAITASGADVQGNYTVTYEVGKLTITAKSIISRDETGISVTGLENVQYDGQNHKQEPTVTDTKTGKVLVSGTDYTLVYPEDTTNAGTVIITVKGIGNYSDEDIVSYDITKRNVKLTSETAEKPYDGTPLTRPTVKVEGDGFVEGEVTDLKATGTITNVGGPVANPITFTKLENFKDGNYTIEQAVGELTITAKSIEGEDSGLVVEKTADVTYNGKEQNQKPVVKDTKLNATLVEDTDYTLTYSEDVKNAGTVTVTVTGKGNYSGTLEATYSIIARKVTLTSGSASKEYDGKPFTKAGVVISEDGFVEDEIADVLAVGTITNVGSVDNTIKIVATDKFNENNYVIKYELGKLTVTEKNNPKPEPTEEPKGGPVDTVWNEEKGICEKAVVVPVVPGGGNQPKATPEPTIAPSETPEASAIPTIEPTSTPKPTSSAETGIIDDDATPSTARKEHWALINLIAAIGSVLFGLLLLLSKNKKDNDNEDEDATDEEGTQKRNKVWKVVSLVDAIIAVVVFVLTENMKQPMVLVDKWTMLMILFTLISIVSFAFGRKYHEEDNTAENA